MAFIPLYAAAVRVIRFTLRPFVWSELCQSRNRIRCRRVLTGVDGHEPVLVGTNERPEYELKTGMRCCSGHRSLGVGLAGSRIGSRTATYDRWVHEIERDSARLRGRYA